MLRGQYVVARLCSLDNVQEVMMQREQQNPANSIMPRGKIAGPVFMFVVVVAVCWSTHDKGKGRMVIAWLYYRQMC